jgi:hypothetical protein
MNPNDSAVFAPACDFSLSAISPTNANVTTGAPYEAFYWHPPAYTDGGLQHTGVVENALLGWLSSWNNGGEYRQRAATGGVFMASMASGVVATVSIPWFTTGVYSLVSADGTVASNFMQAGTTTATVVFSGLTTNWFTNVLVNPTALIVSDFYDWSADAVDGWYTNRNQRPTGTFVWDLYPPPSVDARIDTAFPTNAWIHWQFSRCHP